MCVSTVKQLTALLKNAFIGLHVQVPQSECESMAELIHRFMDHDKRIYHNSSHIFDLCPGLNPRQILAALFHDIVYYQLDQNVVYQVENLFDTVIRIDQRDLFLKEVPGNELAVLLCTGIFGFQNGEKLSIQNGLNEFLSAVLGARLLKPYLSVNDLIGIVACIEATIPFRGNKHKTNTENFPEHLADKILQTCLSLNLEISEISIEEIIHDAVGLANQDVLSFAVIEPADFLASTWLLIEESSPSVKALGMDLIKNYRIAIQNMYQFLSNLNTDNIYHEFKGTPNREIMANLQQVAGKNIEFAMKYLETKLVAIAMVEALVVKAGNENPTDLFFKADKLTQNLSSVYESLGLSDIEIDQALLHVLESGEILVSAHNIKTSPLEALVYRTIGKNNLKSMFQNANAFFDNTISAASYLEKQPQSLRYVLNGMY